MFRVVIASSGAEKAGRSGHSEKEKKSLRVELIEIDDRPDGIGTSVERNVGGWAVVTGQAAP